jgi:hypothetical protein
MPSSTSNAIFIHLVFLRQICIFFHSVFSHEWNICLFTPVSALVSYLDERWTHPLWTSIKFNVFLYLPIMWSFTLISENQVLLVFKVNPSNLPNVMFYRKCLHGLQMLYICYSLVDCS